MKYNVIRSENINICKNLIIIHIHIDVCIQMQIC